MNKKHIMKIYNEKDLEKAFHQKETTIQIKDEIIGNSFLLAGKVQDDRLPIIVLKRLEGDDVCKVSVGEGTVINVTKELASNLFVLLDALENEGIEIDVEEVAERKINLFYGN